MKKNFLFTMFIMLMTSISSFAQKEYNMVITLSNGTTVTLGHNDIKEITFNDGDVAISGNMVNTIDSLAQVTCDLNAGILKNEVYNLDQDDRIMRLTKRTDYNFQEIMSHISQLYDSISQIMDTIEKLHPEIAETSKYKKVKAAVTTMKNNAVRIPALN